MKLSRRDFLKLGALTLGSLGTLAFAPYPDPRDEREIPLLPIARIAVDRQAAIYREPREHSWVVRWTLQDELLNIYYTLTPPEGPAYNPFWFRVWDGYIHSAYVQTVYYRYNTPLESIPESGQLAEVTVPYTQAYQHSRAQGWQEHHFRLYYETTHWITDIVEGPDNRPWYQLTSEATDYLVYYVPATHLRPISPDEIAPISPDLPGDAKRIEISLERQFLTAYEVDKVVFGARISSGMGQKDVPVGTRTPKGEYHITSKSPSKHMGSLSASGAPGTYSLPGVPWTSFFIYESGVALHGTFWHNNFGIPMSHGCINLRNADAKWLFRWVTPAYEYPIADRFGWDVRGYGTRVSIK
ncbi:MAG TPA: L,D-transpeptidase [Anaerolineales bacterium]|nr:L,D-transpeptidase [Anaerolineales bacterium]